MSRVELDSSILLANTPEEIDRCFAVFQELRPTLKDKAAFIRQIQRQSIQGYQLFFIQDGSEVGACIGFRMFETLAWGKILYIDDLITREQSRQKGLADRLLTFAMEKGRLEGCKEVHLDSGHHRHLAHRFYLNRKFLLTCHHFSLSL